MPAACMRAACRLLRVPACIARTVCGTRDEPMATRARLAAARAGDDSSRDDSAAPRGRVAETQSHGRRLHLQEEPVSEAVLRLF